MVLSVENIIDLFKKYYAFTIGILEDALFRSIAEEIESFITYLNNLIIVRQVGWGGQLWTDFWRVFLSRREEKADYNFSIKAIALFHNLFGELDSSKISDPITILDFEKAIITIHKARGTESGILADVKRICNSANVSLVHYNQDQCGWIGDITSPEITPELAYDPDNSMCFMDLDNMIIVNAENRGSRSNIEIRKIIRHDFVPLKYNLKTNITNNSEVKESYSTDAFGDMVFGSFTMGGENIVGVVSEGDDSFGSALFGSTVLGGEEPPSI